MCGGMKRRIFYAHIYWSVVAGCPAHGLATPAIQFTFDCCLLRDDLARLGGMAGFSPSAYRRRMSLQKETPTLKRRFSRKEKAVCQKTKRNSSSSRLPKTDKRGKCASLPCSSREDDPCIGLGCSGPSGDLPVCLCLSHLGIVWCVFRSQQQSSRIDSRGEVRLALGIEGQTQVQMLCMP